MFPAAISSSTSLSEEASISSGTRVQDLGGLISTFSPHPSPQLKIKKKRSLPGNPDPDAEVIALSPKTLLTTNRFVCEICNKGFQRDQNLQLHRRGHNLPWKLKQRSSKDISKRAYVCPEPTCVHHHPSRALGDLTGIKKHYCRKHGEKKWKCEKCSKIYAVQSDWKAHSKTCGTREYRCDCGTLFSRKDSFITHRAFCDALAEESARLSVAQRQLVSAAVFSAHSQPPSLYPLNHWDPQNPNHPDHTTPRQQHFQVVPPLPATSALGTHHHHLSATALLRKAAIMGATVPAGGLSMACQLDTSLGTWQKDSDRMTRDFLGLTGEEESTMGGGRQVMLTYEGGDVGFPHANFGYVQPPPQASETWGDC